MHVKGACESVVRREGTVRSSATKQMANKRMRQSGTVGTLRTGTGRDGDGDGIVCE